MLGDLGGVPVAVLQGRRHLYEGAAGRADRDPDPRPPRRGRRDADPHERRRLAAPRARPREPHGDHATTSTCIGANPLTGPNDDALGPRFPSLRDAYDPELRATLHDTAGATSASPLADGVYLAVSGPSFETPAEIRAFRTLGADAVGMSTVPETIVARHAGLRVAAISAITNLAEGLSAEPLSHEQTLRDAQGAAGDLSGLLDRVRGRLRERADDLRARARRRRPDPARAPRRRRGDRRARRQGGHRRGPRRRDLRLPRVDRARRCGAGVRVAAVANFPAGEDDPDLAAREAGEAVAAGAAEIDVVVPWPAFLAGDETAIARTVAATRAAIGGGVGLKAILETGSLGGAGRGPAAPASRRSARARTS